MIAGNPEVLRKAKALDEMERSVTSSEADVLECVLLAFRNGQPPKNRDAEKIEAMYTKYLEPKEADGGDAAPGGDDDREYPIADEIDL